MQIVTTSGYLTATQKKHIKAIFDAELRAGAINGISYQIEPENNQYKVKISKKDRGLIPCSGSELRISNYYATFKIR